jgi:hypothetical protein
MDLVFAQLHSGTSETSIARPHCGVKWTIFAQGIALRKRSNAVVFLNGDTEPIQRACSQQVRYDCRTGKCPGK